jgi:hypothetical protein
MAQTREAMTHNLAERLWWQVARRDDARVARRHGRGRGPRGPSAQRRWRITWCS